MFIGDLQGVLGGCVVSWTEGEEAEVGDVYL